MTEKTEKKKDREAVSDPQEATMPEIEQDIEEAIDFTNTPVVEPTEPPMPEIREIKPIKQVGKRVIAWR